MRDDAEMGRRRVGVFGRVLIRDGWGVTGKEMWGYLRGNFCFRGF